MAQQMSNNLAQPLRMASGSLFMLMMTMILHVLPLRSYTHGFIKLKPRDASENEVFLTSAVVRFEMCPTYANLNTTCDEEFAAVKAKFGPPSRGEIVGSFKAVMPKDACGHVQMTESQDSSLSHPVIALISQGNCSYDTKVANAERAGFFAALVYATQEDTSLIEMESSIPAVPVSIPAFFVGHHTGTVLIYTSIMSNSTRAALLSISTLEPSASKGAKNLQNTKKVDGRSNRGGADTMADGTDGGDSNFGERYFHICIYIWACVVVSSLIALSIKWGCCSRSLTRWEVKKIPLKRFRRSEGFEYQDKCPICHEEFLEGFLVRQLPCNHCYHSYCVDRWLVKMSNRCPLCKQRVSVSLLCSWNKQQDSDNLTQSAAEAEAEASVGELPPLPPIQSLTPNSLYGETIMSGPSKFIIMRPGRPTRIIEVPKKEEAKTRVSRSVRVVPKPLPAQQEDFTTHCASESPHADVHHHKQLPVSSNDVVLQLSDTCACAQDPLGEQIFLERLDTESGANSSGKSPGCNAQPLLPDENGKSNGSVTDIIPGEKLCNCDNMHRLWLNRPEDVVSPLLNSGSSEFSISCANCANEYMSVDDDDASHRVHHHPSQVLLLSHSSSPSLSPSPSSASSSSSSMDIVACST